MTAEEMSAQIRTLNNENQVWDHELPNGMRVRVRWMPARQLGHRYLVWATRRGWDNFHQRERGRGFSSEPITAMTAKTAGRKARSLATRYGAS